MTKIETVQKKGGNDWMGIIRRDKVEIIKQCLTAVNFPASDKFFNLFQTHFTIQQVGARVSWRACFKIELELKEKFRGVLLYLTKSFSVNYFIFESSSMYYLR